MYTPDNVGRIFLDEDSFLAPFGHFKKDWEYVYNFLKDPQIGKRLLHDGMDFDSVCAITATQLKTNTSYIGFYKGQRSGYIILEKISVIPNIYILHGGINRKLYGTGLPQKVLGYVKQFVFEEQKADKLEGIVMHPNNILEGYFKRGGLKLDCEISDRISVNKKLFPVKIFGMASDEYTPIEKENHHGGKPTTTTSRPITTTSSADANRCTKKGKRKVGRRKKHKRR